MPNDKQVNSNGDKADEASPLHKLLGLTPEQVRREIIEEGYDPDEKVAAMRRLGVVLAAQYAPQIERERTVGSVPFAKSYPIFDEAVAAGEPEWTGITGNSNDASLFAIMGGGSPEEFMWARVSGWSMRDAGIKHGDVVLVNRKAEPKDGDVVLAHLAGRGQLVKRIRLVGHKTAVLESANPDFADIAVNDPSEMSIHGVVVGRAGTL